MRKRYILWKAVDIGDCNDSDVCIDWLSWNCRECVIDYGDSKLYTTEEIDDVVDLVKDEFKTLDGCTLYTLSYAGDEWSEREKDYRNSGQEETKYVSCIVLNSSFWLKFILDDYGAE